MANAENNLDLHFKDYFLDSVYYLPWCVLFLTIGAMVTRKSDSEIGLRFWETGTRALYEGVGWSRLMVWRMGCSGR